MSELIEDRHVATRLGVEEVKDPKLREVLNEGQATTHLGDVEVEDLKLSEVLKKR